MAKAIAQPKRAATLRARDDRFGDGPTPGSSSRPDKGKVGVQPPIAPLHTFMGHPYTPTTAGKGDLVGSAATPTPRWGNERYVPSRRPDEYDYINDLGPGRYMGQKHPYDRKGATWYIGPGGPRLRRAQTAAGDTMVVLPPAVGKQSLSSCRTEPSLTFGISAEKRMVHKVTLSKQQAESQASLLHRQKKGTGAPLDAAEREQLQGFNRAFSVEEGGHTSSMYMPASIFGEKATNASQSASFGVMTTNRFDAASSTGHLHGSASAASLALAPPPFGGRTGVAFRENPVATPGPGSYEIDRGFDGQGTQRLSHSRSASAYTLLGKTPRDRGGHFSTSWKSDDFPASPTYGIGSIDGASEPPKTKK